MRFSQQILAADGRLITQAMVQIACVSHPQMKPVAIPENQGSAVKCTLKFRLLACSGKPVCWSNLVSDDPDGHVGRLLGADHPAFQGHQGGQSRLRAV